jgi:hypothetical protein
MIPEKLNEKTKVFLINSIKKIARVIFKTEDIIFYSINKPNFGLGLLPEPINNQTYHLMVEFENTKKIEILFKIDTKSSINGNIIRYNVKNPNKKSFNEKEVSISSLEEERSEDTYIF